VDTAEFDKMFEVEETNWWYRGRRRLVTRWLEPFHRRRGPLRILDIASATGMGFRYLAKYGEVRGVDISEETIRLCRSRGIEGIVRGDAMALPFRDGSFDAVLALDALEHFPDDRQAMAEIRRVCTSDALVLITVPAFMFLWSAHDDAYHHVRRYTRGELGAKLRQQGFTLDKLTYYSMTLLPPVYVMRKLRTLTKGEGPVRSDFFLPLPRPVEAMLSGIMRSEIALTGLVDLPFGVSLFCSCRPG
jgi:SAM-dependent methyltransferase